METWKQINLTIFLEFFIVNFFNSVCLNSLALFFFISIQSFIIHFIQVFSPLLVAQPVLSSTYSCFLRGLFCFQNSYSTPRHSWKACSHSPLDNAATDPKRVKIIYTVCSPCYGMHIWCYQESAIPPKDRGMKKRKRNKFYFLGQWSLRIRLKTDDNFPVADCVKKTPKNGTSNKSCFLQNAKHSIWQCESSTWGVKRVHIKAHSAIMLSISYQKV